MKGIKYEIENNSERRRIYNWHDPRAPRVKDLSLGAEDFDVQKIKSKVAKLNNNRNYSSDYTLGFEVEKNSFHTTRLKEYALIRCYEKDVSCGVSSGVRGVEAITNILPMIPPSIWRMKIYDMMYKARKIIDDEYSPSNYRCGGHMTIGVKGYDGAELLDRVRLNASILMACFTPRLKNTYCRYNLRMQPFRNADGERIEHFNGWDGKYQLALVKRGGLVEFRLPNRISSYKEMIRRYELMYEIVDFSITKPDGRFSTLLRKVKPILMLMYSRDASKVSERLQWAKHFNRFVKDGTIHNSIRDFIM